MKNILTYGSIRISLMFFLGCSQHTYQSQISSLAPSTQPTAFANIFEKSEDLNEDEAYSIELKQAESTEYDLSVGVGGVPPPPPPPPPVVLNSDPLVIQLQANSNLLLSSPADGVVFDIFGDNFVKGRRKVSWTIGYAFGFLALPNENNQVVGIHQLFGDRTLGPDRKPAAHGFDALIKYDGYLGEGQYSLSQRNFVIDKNDAYFSKFRIWIDKNRNGLSSEDEFQTLEQAGIESIDLKYDAKYSERDKHGNIIAHKSYAKKSDGSTSLVFDLWLRLAAAQ